MHVTDLNVIPPGRSTGAQAGYDHRWFPWSATRDRPPRQWPGGRRVAVCVVLDATAFEFPLDDVVPPPGGRGVAPYPDFPRASHREFGHRVGAFRCLEMFESANVPFTLALDVLTSTHYRPLAEQAADAANGVVAAGLSANRPITSLMSEEEERHYVRTSLEALAPLTAGGPLGWQGPQHSESSRTPRILSEAGVDYVMDWGNDDSAYPFGAAAPGLWSVPASWELADVNAMFHRGMSPWSYADMLVNYVRALADEEPQYGAVVTIQLSGWLTGQAFRATAIENALSTLRSDPRIWFASTPEIINRLNSRE